MPTSTNWNKSPMTPKPPITTTSTATTTERATAVSTAMKDMEPKGTAQRNTALRGTARKAKLLKRTTGVSKSRSLKPLRSARSKLLEWIL